MKFVYHQLNRKCIIQSYSHEKLVRTLKVYECICMCELLPSIDFLFLLHKDSHTYLVPVQFNEIDILFCQLSQNMETDCLLQVFYTCFVP